MAAVCLVSSRVTTATAAGFVADPEPARADRGSPRVERRRAGTALAVGLAEVYSEIVGAQAHTRRNVERAQLRVFAGNALAVVFGAAFPALFFVLAAIGLVEMHTAFTLSKWTGLGLICTYGYFAARLAGAGLGRALFEAAAVGTVGGVLIAIKALVH